MRQTGVGSTDQAASDEAWWQDMPEVPTDDGTPFLAARMPPGRLTSVRVCGSAKAAARFLFLQGVAVVLGSLVFSVAVVGAVTTYFGKGFRHADLPATLHGKEDFSFNAKYWVPSYEDPGGYQVYENTYINGPLAAGDSRVRDILDSFVRCQELGGACAGFTCSRGDQECTVRQESFLRRGAEGVSSHVKPPQQLENEKPPTDPYPKPHVDTAPVPRAHKVVAPPRPRAPPPPQPSAQTGYASHPPQPGLPGSALMCNSFESCGGENFGMVSWRTSPRTLAAAAFDGFRGVNGDALAKATRVWRQAPPVLPGGGVATFGKVQEFVRELLSSDPYFSGGEAVPYVDLGTGAGGRVVAITQRQLAFNVANVLMGNDIPGGTGLGAALHRCTSSDIVLSLLSFLAVLAQELAGGGQGTMLVAAVPRGLDASWRSRLDNSALFDPSILVKVPGHPSWDAAPDFMSGGLAFQALTDIAGGDIGGGANLCHTANTQDESLVQFYSEVLAFSFFARGSGMLPSPMTFLGTRRYMNQLEGETSTQAPYLGRCGYIPERNWINTDIPRQTVSATLAGRTSPFAASAFVAAASTIAEHGRCQGGTMVNNECDAQRRHLDKDISKWFQAFEATMYNRVVQDAFRTIIRRVGTGPWGAGAWQGDSQHYFLTVWIATALLGVGAPSLDYYIYDHFCENAGNQCFLLGQGNGCAECIGRSGVGALRADRCGWQDIWGIVARFRGKPTRMLYEALLNVKPPPRQVFDVV